MPEPVKCIVLEKTSVVSPGVLFEPLQRDAQGFTYGLFQTVTGNEEEVVILFHDYRVILRGLRMRSLLDDFTFQRVRYVRQVSSTEKALAGIGESKDPIVTEITIEHLNTEET